MEAKTLVKEITIAILMDTTVMTIIVVIMEEIIVEAIIVETIVVMIGATAVAITGVVIHLDHILVSVMEAVLGHLAMVEPSADLTVGL